MKPVGGWWRPFSLVHPLPCPLPASLARGVRAAAVALAACLAIVTSAVADVAECENRPPAGPPRTLAPGSPPVKVIVCAQQKWNDAAIAVEAGQVYRLSAAGEWHDAAIPAGPEGYASDTPRLAKWQQVLFQLAEPSRRAPDLNWFALVCGVSEIETSWFAVVRTPEWTVPMNGTLGCFANDLTVKYGNNRGFVTLTVERLR